MLPAPLRQEIPTQEAQTAAPVASKPSRERVWDPQTRRMLSEMRWRRGPRDRKHFRWALLVAILLHVLFVFVLNSGMRLHEVVDTSDVVHVELIEMAPPAPPLVVEPPPAAKTAPVQTASPIRPQAPRSQTTAPASEPATIAKPVQESTAIHIYKPDSSLDIPNDLVETMDKEAEASRLYRPKVFALAPMLQHKRKYRTRETLFERKWSVPKNETLLHQLVRQYFSGEKTYKTPWGGRVRCAWLFAIVGCSGVPPDPWKVPALWKPPLDDYEE
jgi:hypothetical protein